MSTSSLTNDAPSSASAARLRTPVVIGGGIALLLTISGALLGVPLGWPLLASVVYFGALVGLAVAPMLRLHTLVALVIALGVGAVGFISLVTALIVGLLSDPISQQAETVMLVLAAVYCLALVLLLVAIGLAATPRGRVVAKAVVSGLYVTLAAVAIAAVQLAWAVRLHL